MAFKLTKQQSQDWNKHIENVREHLHALSDSVNRFNSALADTLRTLQEIADDYNTAVDEAKEFVNSIGEDWRGQFDEKSETWQEGDKGQEVSEIIEGMENYAPEKFEFNTVDLLDEPAESEALDDLEGTKPEE